MRKQVLLFAVFFLFAVQLSAQSPAIYPTNWWANMKYNKLQLLVHDSTQNFSKQTVTISYPGITVNKTNHLENSHYLAVDITISAAAKSGIVNIIFKDGRKSSTVKWPLEKRREGRGTAFAQGVRSQDLIYLLMPDRFSNGDESNDRITGMKDQSLNREKVYDRHGGDLKGVENHLDYLKDLGVTTVWMTPVVENDMPSRTEHGYAVTNDYKVDPRLGGNEAYKNLSAAIHKNGMKLIQDIVYNHVGLYHFTVVDKPMHDWLNEWPHYTQTTYKDQVIFDPHAAASQQKLMTDGWFTREMPDMNERNPYVANYLIQHALWSVEEFGVDGWRIDTYAYNDLPFMNRCNKALMDEYPLITIFGETWVHGVINQSYFCQNNYDIPFKSNLQNTTDFQQLFYGIMPALNEKFGWTEGVNKLYTTTAQDLVYKNSMGEVIFLDNHDLPRSFSVFGEDIEKYKMALGWLLTFRGVPQMYYGMEHLMKGLTSPNDGLVRKDFLGGWKGDSANKFTAAGRTADENNVFNYIRTLANFRKSASAITTGKLMQYTPDHDGLYVYFRYDAKQTIMCIMNTSDSVQEINFSNYPERTNHFRACKNVISGEEYGSSFTIPAKRMLVAEMKK
jgi:glycosidase